MEEEEIMLTISINDIMSIVKNNYAKHNTPNDYFNAVKEDLGYAVLWEVMHNDEEEEEIDMDWLDSNINKAIEHEKDD